MKHKLVIAAMLFAGAAFGQCGTMVVNGKTHQLDCTGPRAISYCAPASASGTTYTCTPSPALTAYAAGTTLAFVPDVNGSGGATTVNVNSLGAKSVKLTDGTTNPTGSTFASGSAYTLTYDGTVFRVNTGGPSCVKTSIASTALTAAATSQDVNLGAAIPTDSFVTFVRVKEQTRFTCTGGCANISTLNVSVGVSGVPTAYAPAFSLMQAVSNTNLFGYGPIAYTSASNQLVAHVMVTNTSPGNLGTGSVGNLTAGSVDVHFCYTTLP